MKRTLLFLLLGSLIACQQTPKKSTAPEATGVQVDTLINDDYVFLEIDKFSNGQFQLKWGDHSFLNTTPDTLEASAHPDLKWYNEEMICLEGACGNKCSFAYILPLQENALPRQYLYPVTYLPDDNLILYSTNIIKDKNLATVESLDNGKKMDIRVKYFPGTPPFEAIDSAAFESRKLLYLRWKHVTGKKVVRIFNIRLK
ncbi:hypothetical protein COR50_16200 [Chitinophaga caeni]|uniref:Lipoprotein n=1 Tax=Chitinophaga caeni TaxID=2029983 RepID=A0A291QX22_9BACT|nr:hypothetical protein [Chitinophaga caeni]ATL48579.1 hypothetical protein COR50_16200 [Chitinophaga caeni]